MGSKNLYLFAFYQWRWWRSQSTIDDDFSRTVGYNLIVVYKLTNDVDFLNAMEEIADYQVPIASMPSKWRVRIKLVETNTDLQYKLDKHHIYMVLGPDTPASDRQLGFLRIETMYKQNFYYYFDHLADQG